MDKYEYNQKFDQIKSLCSEENYDAAADLCDSITWSKIRNVNALVKAAEVYEKVNRYEEARDILMLAYDRSPIGRMIIYRLAELAIKMGEMSDADTYYQEFVEIAPRDNLKYVLLYEITKAKGGSYMDLIPILEQLKEQEYTEEWSYELAYLYHKAGMIEKCIEACDELILWFGDGPYVERALELKMLYQPLSKAQEEKYRSFRLAKEGVTTINSEEMESAGEFGHKTVDIPQVTLSPERFNTQNLQAEIAKGIQQIMEATEKDTVIDTMDNIKKMAEDIPYLTLPSEEEKREMPHIETDEEIDGSLKINFQELLGEESDGQMSLMVDDEKQQLERQITGQMTIADVLGEWEKTKRAAEIAMEEANQRRLDSAKQRALQEAGDIMDRLAGVIPQLDAGVQPAELLHNEYMNAEPQAAEEIPEEIAPIPAEEPQETAEETLAVAEPEFTPEEESDSLSLAAAASLAEAGIEHTEEMHELVPEVTYPEELLPKTSDITAAVEAIAEMEAKAAAEEFGVEPEQTESKPEEEISVKEIKPKEEVPPIKEEEAQAKKEPVADKKVDHLSPEQKAIFSYFVPVKGMEDQLCQALETVGNHLRRSEAANTGNLIIQGGRGCGKTVLSTSMIKVLQKDTGRLTGKIGKISADALNKKDAQGLLQKVSGGCLIIEQAGDLTRETAIKLSLLLKNDKSGVLVILEDTSKGIKKALSLDDTFAGMFGGTITVPIFTNDELISFAKSYSEELGYAIDEMAVLALYNRISNIQRLDQATTLTEVKEIVDEAIVREKHGGMKKYFSILTASRYTDDDRIVLRERNFE